MKVGIIGGSGFYSLLENAEALEIKTPFGNPSSTLTIGEVSGKEVIFLPRHGKGHIMPPHVIPYKANIWALKQAGVTHIIAPTAVGSLKADIKPGDFVVPDQFVNFTRREDTFYDGEVSKIDKRTTHISTVDPYCPSLRKELINTARSMGFSLNDKGTVVVIQGPRFSTKAESLMYRKLGFDIINMTQYPECVLARELEMCYANISIVTDYDAGLKEDPTVEPVTTEEVIRVFEENNKKIKQMIMKVIPKIEESNCICRNALKNARF